MKQKYIFLDIDGVLTFTYASLFISGMRAPFMGRYEIDEFDPTGLAILKRVIELLDFKVILSSTWAGNASKEDLDKLGRTLGIEFVGMIKDDYGCGRNKLVNDYLLEHPEVEDFIIIDDEYVPFICTSNESRVIHTPDGINAKTVEKIGKLYNIDMWKLSGAGRRSNDDDEDLLWSPTIS